MREWVRESDYSEEIENAATSANVRRPDTHYRYSRDTSITYDCKPRSHVSINDDKVAQKTALNPQRLIFESEPELHLFQARPAAMPLISRYAVTASAIDITG